MKKLKKIGIPVLLVLCLIAGLLLFMKPETKRVAVVELGNVESFVEGNGTLSGGREIVYYAKVNASVAAIHGETGDVLEKDSRIIQYDLQELELEAAKAAENQKLCQNGYDAALEDNQKYQKRFETAENDELSYGQRYEEIMLKLNELDLTQYTENLEIENQNRELYQKVLKLNQQIIEKTTEISILQQKSTLATFEGNAWDVKFLEGQSESVQKELEQFNIAAVNLEQEMNSLPKPQMESEEYALYLELTRQLEDISRKWSQAKTDKNTSEARLMNEYAVAQLKNSLDIATLTADYARQNLEEGRTGVCVAANAILTKVYVKEGTYVTKGTPLFSVETTDEAKVSLELSKYDIEKVAVGQSAVIVIGSRSYEGRVQRIQRTAVKDASDNAKVTVEIGIENPDDDMIFGLEADVKISTGSVKDVIALPQEAVYIDDGGSYCYIVKNSRIEKRYFTAGLTGSDWTEVLDGIEQGTHVIVDAVMDASIGERIDEKFN